MNQHQMPQRAMPDVIDQYVRTRPGGVAVSTSRAIRAIREIVPDCGLTDRELSDLVAASAIRRGRNIAFDLQDQA